jgi:hypothetical protein
MRKEKDPLRDYLVSFNGNHLRVKRLDGKGDIPWDHLQLVKNETAGSEAVAIEIYPPEDKLINDANIRHLWVVDSIPEGCDLSEGRYVSVRSGATRKID